MYKSEKWVFDVLIYDSDWDGSYEFFVFDIQKPFPKIISNLFIVKYKIDYT